MATHSTQEEAWGNPGKQVEDFIGDMVEVSFKVEGVVNLGEEEFVCVSGNRPPLGNWNIKSCFPLKKDKDCPHTWSNALSLSSKTALEYRYAIVQNLSPRGADRDAPIRLKCWESTLNPRKASLSRLGGDRVELEGVFGENEVGEKGMDEGWLVSESEIRLRIMSSSDNFSPFFHSVLVESFNTHASSQTAVPPRVKVGILNRSSGDGKWVEQEAHGFSFSESESRMIVYSARDISFSQTGFLISFLAPGITPSTLIGQTSLLPRHFLSGDLTHGMVHLTVVSVDLQPIGTIHLDYLLIHPVKDCAVVHSMQKSIANHWTSRKRTLDIGHRGLGDSYRSNREENPPVIENTIKSLKLAGECRADYVEFDVQLTRDLIPAVYHDFRVCITALGEEDQSCHLHEVFVKDLTLDQLHSLRLHHEKCKKNGGECLCRAGGEYHGDVEARPFPTLEEVCQSIPHDVGFNIEVKYPVPEWGSDEYDFPYFDRNVMADCIISTVYLHARHRKIVFSCFDADMCSILHLKQPMIPVLFLTTNESPEFNCPKDVRSQSIHEAIMHAKAEKFLGINIDSYQLLKDPSLVSYVRDEKKLVLFTWGSHNNSAKNLRMEKELGVDGVIYDRIDKLMYSSQVDEDNTQS